MTRGRLYAKRHHGGPRRVDGVTFGLALDLDPGRYAVRVEAPGEAAEAIFAVAPSAVLA